MSAAPCGRSFPVQGVEALVILVLLSEVVEDTSALRSRSCSAWLKFAEKIQELTLLETRPQLHLQCEISWVFCSALKILSEGNAWLKSACR